ncbi:MAG: hypothetical protein ACK5KU_03130 [Beutenbergiaceae bacterium]
MSAPFSNSALFEAQGFDVGSGWMCVTDGPIGIGGNEGDVALVSTASAVGLLLPARLAGVVADRIPQKRILLVVASVEFLGMALVAVYWWCAGLLPHGSIRMPRRYLSVMNVIWGTLLQRRVPPQMLGRVASLDFFVSLGLMPISMALAAPVAAALGFAYHLHRGGGTAADLRRGGDCGGQTPGR